MIRLFLRNLVELSRKCEMKGKIQTDGQNSHM